MSDFPTKIDISRKRGDTRRIVFKLKDSETGNAIDVTGWTGLLLTVDPAPNPTDNTNNVEQFTGSILDAVGGRISFTPTGNIPVGVYFYDVQAIDANSEKVTFAEGQYSVGQDITKD